MALGAKKLKAMNDKYRVLPISLFWECNILLLKLILEYASNIFNGIFALKFGTF